MWGKDREQERNYMKAVRPQAWTQAEARTATTPLYVGAFLCYLDQMKFRFAEVLDWSDAGGTWTFIVSQDGERWFRLAQVAIASEAEARKYEHYTAALGVPNYGFQLGDDAILAANGVDALALAQQLKEEN